MDPRYTRNLPALTEEECALLHTKRALIVGCGGLGGYLIELLARIGIGTLRVVDDDVFDATNLNRQLLCTPDLIGTAKVQTARARIHSINPAVIVEERPLLLTAQNARELMADCDIVLDALDNIEGRQCLYDAAQQSGVPYVYGAITGWVAQAALFLPGEAGIHALYPKGVALTDRSVLSFTPALCASMQASLAVNQLCGRPVESGILHYVDLSSMEFESFALHH